MQPPGSKRGPFRRWVVLRGRREPEPAAPAPAAVPRPQPEAPPGRDAADRAPSLEELEAEASYQRNRLALYKRRIFTGQATTPQRLRELERAMESSRERLRRARRRPRESA